MLDGKLSAGSQTLLIELFDSLQGAPARKINQQDVALSGLENELELLLRGKAPRLVLLKPDGQLPLAGVAAVIDRCQG